MPLNMQKELQKTYDEAVMKHEARSLRKGDDWKKQQEIIKYGKLERKRMKELYDREYKTRVESERKRLVKQGAEKNYQHPVPIGQGRDRFDRDAIDRQAHRNVEFAHEQTLQASRDNQENAVKSLQQSARRRDANQGKSKHAFEKASGKQKEMKHAFARAAPQRSR